MSAWALVSRMIRNDSPLLLPEQAPLKTIHPHTPGRRLEVEKGGGESVYVCVCA